MGTLTEGILTSDGGVIATSGTLEAFSEITVSSDTAFILSSGGRVASDISFSSVGSAGDGESATDEPERSTATILAYLR
jgi:patatin-like phospholipase/acyl hydrolase